MLEKHTPGAVRREDSEGDRSTAAGTERYVLVTSPNAGLTPRDVHLWLVSLDRPPLPNRALNEVLSRDERERASRFRFPRDQRRYSAGRGLLRHILASYLDADPASLTFDYSRFGKPALRGVTDLAFNLSRSRDQLLVGISGSGDVGIDIECLKPLTDLDAIARRFFAPGESVRLQAVPERAKVRAFFECWTRKEAFIKAVGEGLSMSLDSFEVTFGPGVQPSLHTVGGSRRVAREWSLWSLAPSPGVLGAVAARGRGLTLRTMRWARPRAMALSPSIGADPAFP